MFVAQMPVMANEWFLGGTLFSVGAVVLAERVCAIISHRRRWAEPTMPLGQIQERFAAQQKAIDALGEAIREADAARSRDVRMICEELRRTNHATAASLNEVARALGRIEGRQQPEKK